MKIVILAAGRGKRMRELTADTPKPLLKHGREHLITNKLKSIPGNTTEIIIVIGYLGEQIKSFIGEKYTTEQRKEIPIKYVEQKETLGTAHALWQCRELLNSPFIVLMSDDIYDSADIEKLSILPEDQWAVLAFRENSDSKAGKLAIDENGNLVGIYESPENSVEYNLTYTGVCRLTPEIFDREMVPISNNEFGLPQTFCQFIGSRDIKIFETANWERITAPEDLKK